MKLDGLNKIPEKDNNPYAILHRDFLLGSQFLSGKDVRPTGSNTSPVSPLFFNLT